MYSPLELISLVFSTSRGWHRKVAQPPCGETAPSRHVKGRAAAGGRERPITYGDEAGQEVCEYVVAHDSRSQDQLLGLVVAGQLKGRGNNNEGQGHLNRDQEKDCDPERKMVLRTTPLSRTATLEMGGAAQTLLLCQPFCFPLIVVAMGEPQTEGTAFESFNVEFIKTHNVKAIKEVE